MTIEKKEQFAGALEGLGIVILGSIARADADGMACTEISKCFGKVPNEIRGILMELMISQGLIKHVKATEGKPCHFVFCGTEVEKYQILFEAITRIALKSRGV